MNNINLTFPEAILTVLYVSLFASHDFDSPKGALKQKMDRCDRAVKTMHEYLGEQFPTPLKKMEDRIIELVATTSHLKLLCAAGVTLKYHDVQLDINDRLFDLAKGILEADCPHGLNLKEKTTLALVQLVLLAPQLIPDI